MGRMHRRRGRYTTPSPFSVGRSDSCTRKVHKAHHHPTITPTNSARTHPPAPNPITTTATAIATTQSRRIAIQNVHHQPAPPSQASQHTVNQSSFNPQADNPTRPTLFPAQMHLTPSNNYPPTLQTRTHTRIPQNQKSLTHSRPGCATRDEQHAQHAEPFLAPSKSIVLTSKTQAPPRYRRHRCQQTPIAQHTTEPTITIQSQPTPTNRQQQHRLSKPPPSVASADG